MDPTTIQTACSWIAITKDIVVGLAAAFMAIMAYLGLSAWQRELKGKSEYQMSKDVLKAVYNVREAFKHVRHIAIYSYEYPKEMRDHHGHLKNEHDFDGTAHVYKMRWEKLVEAFIELEEKHLEAQVEWGPQFQDIIDPLRKCRSELLITIQAMLYRKKVPHNTLPISTEEASKEHSVLYYAGEDNKFTLEINEAVKKFEEWLRPHIIRGRKAKKRGKWFASR